jgi:signal transduction histidine kinase
VVLGYTDLALADSGGLGSVRDDLSAIRTASMRARDLVRQILTFSRRTEGEYTSVDMNALVSESVRFLRATLPADIQLTTNLPDEPVIVHGDATALQQVIVNLGTNAEYAMRGVTDGRLTIALERSDADDGSAALIVRDTGRGMAAGPPVRAVLHNEAGGRGDRDGPGRRAWHHRGAQRHHSC